MNLSDIKKDRIAVLEMYLEQRKAVRDSLYRLLKSAAEVRACPSEFETLSKALALVKDEPWSIERELRELRGEK